MTAPAAQGDEAKPAVEEAQKRGKLVVNSDPPGAYVRIAGELQGDKTPTTIDKLPLDMDIEVKVSREGFEDHVTKVRLGEDKMSDELDVKLARGSVTVTWNVIPRTAIVVLDDKRWEGSETRAEELSTGEHKLMFSAPGHLPQIVKFSAEKGETKNFDVVLKKGDPTAFNKKDDGKVEPPKPEPANDGPPGSVSVASKGGFCTNVIVNGQSVGPTPVAGISVKPGPVSIVCKTADGRTVGSGTVVKSGQTSRVTVTIPSP